MWGRGEWFRGDQIIEYCGSRFVLGELAVDGTRLVLQETDLPIPELGEAVPSFAVPTMSGELLSAEGLKGANYLLDFWASWCSPCVGKFPYLQELEGELQGQLQIITVNVDEPSALNAAREVIDRYSLTWPHVMTGRGTSDPLWKMFGSMEGNRLSIPLYVLVDGASITFASTISTAIPNVKNAPLAAPAKTLPAVKPSS